MSTSSKEPKSKAGFVLLGTVSIVMPVYNGESFIGQAITSVLSQNYPKWELVVVDDGSTDSTARVVGEYSDPRIRYTYQKNRGQTAALNKGLELARGEFITTLDADDWLSPDSLKLRVEFLTKHPNFGVVYGDGIYTDENGKPLLRFTEQMPAGVQGDVYDPLIVSPFYGTGAAVMVRRDVIEGGNIRYDEAIVWCQDWDIYIRMAEKNKFGFINEIIVYYRLHGGGMTMTMPTGRRLDSLIRLRYKVLTSERIRTVAIKQKAAYFYDFLIKDLHGRIDDQTKVFLCEEFRGLPDKQQARLLRLTAIRYLLDGENIHISKKWLRQAWKFTPLDPKSFVAYFAVVINHDLARKLIGTWQSSHNQSGQKSPFELAIKGS